jgi:2-phospho-L-lactate guanylyltransferase
VFALLLPVKEFARSKQRLAGWLTPQERASLAAAMFEDIWETLRTSCRPYPLFVISSEPSVIARCRAEAVPCRVETEQRSHSESVREATCWVMSLGVSSLLSVPIDTPAVTAEEIVTLSDLTSRYAVVVVPSADGTGTNALLRTPPDAIAPQFGPGSRELYVEQARSKGLSHLVHRVAGLAADIDTPEDVERFLALAHSAKLPSRTAKLLRQWTEARRGVAVCS